MPPMQILHEKTLLKHFRLLKPGLKNGPFFVKNDENHEAEYVILSYSAYKNMFETLSKYEEEILEYRLQEAEEHPDTLTDWRNVRRTPD